MIPPRGVTSITSGSSELIITPTVGDVTISINLSAYVPTSRSINTTAPLAGGGTLASDLTLSLLDNGITDAKLRDSAGTSVIGRAAGTVGDPADIVAVSDGDVLRRAGGTLGFGTIPSTSVTGLITAVNAGTNLSGGGTSGAVTLNVVDSPTFAGNVTVQGATGFTVSTPLGTSPAINWQQGTLQTWKLYQVPSNHTLALDNSSGGNVAQFTSAAITWQKPTTFIQYAQWGSLGPYLTTDQTLNFGRGSTGVVDGYINYYGYNGGITQFRNLRICDGKGADIAKFTGSTKQVDFLGPVTVAGNATIGDSAGDAHALNGTLNANSTAGVNGQVLQVIGGLPQWGAPSAASIPTGTGTANKLTKWTGASTLGDSSILTESGSVLMVNGNLNVDSSAASVFGGAGALLLQNSGTGTTVTPLSVMRTSLATNGDVTEVTIGQNAAQARIWTTTLDASDLSGDLRIGTRWYNGTSYVNTDLLVDGNGLTVYRNAYLNATTGSTGIGYASGAALPAKLSVAGTLDVTGAATVSGGVTLGNASTDAHALNGTLAANGTAGTNGQVLQIVSGLPQWGAPASAGIATGSGTANRLVRWTGATTLGDGSIIDDGASATVGDLGGTIQTYSTVGTTNDLPLAANTTILVYNGASAATWTGITGGRDGRLLLILNRSSSTLSLSRENAGSAAADRIWTTDDATSMTVNRRTGILLMYNGADQRWQVMSHPSRLGYLTVDGWVSAMQGVYASNSKASLSNYSLNFGYNDNATIAGKINAVGYADGVTQFRNLQIQDGKGATIATFTGSTKQVDFAGAVTVAGNTTIGDSASDAHTLNGTLAANSTAGSNGQVLQIVGGLPQWAAPSTAGITSGSGTVNRVAKWTGANALGDSTVSDDGTYVYTPSQIWGKWSANTDGGVALAGGTGVTDTTATTNGFDFGMGSGGVVWRSKLATGGTIAGYVGAGSNPGTANQWLSVSGTGDVTFPKAVTVAGNATLGDSTSSDDHIIRGRVSHLCSGFADSFYSSVTSSAATYTVNGATFRSTGSFDTVAAQRFNYGLQAIADANRISEVNALNNIAISATASNGQTNVAIYTADGSNYLNGASGSTGIGYAFGASLPATLAVNGTFATTGAVTLGDASTDAHTLNGTLNANGTAGTNGQVLQIISGLPQWGAPSAAGVVTGTGTVDRVTKWTGTSSLGNSTITDDGTNITLAPATGVHVSTGYLWHGPSINTYISSSSGIGFHFNANLDDQTGYINYAGYGGGTSRTRNLIIADGKGAAVATFTGSTKQVDFAGAITVTGPGGNASGRQDAIRISNFSQATSSDSQVIHWQFNAPDVYNVWAGAKLTGTTPGFLNPKFIVAVQNTNTTGTANVTERLGVHSSGVDVTGWLQSTGGLYANSSNAFLNNGSLNFFYNTNATAQGKINAVGYQEGISQFRDLLIQDGKGATIATFTGSTKQVAFAGAVTIAGNTSLGDASTDAHTLNGTLNANSTAGAEGQVLTIVGGLPKWGGDGYTVILKGADQDASNAFVDDTTLLFPTIAGKLYAVECFLSVAAVSGAGAAGLLRFKTSTGSMDGYGNGWANGIFTAFSAAAASLTNQMSVTQRGSLTIPTAVNVSFAFRQNTSNSNFILQFSATNSGDTMRMLAGSWMRYRQLN
jgi:hypothetical protein